MDKSRNRALPQLLCYRTGRIPSPAPCRSQQGDRSRRRRSCGGVRMQGQGGTCSCRGVCGSATGCLQPYSQQQKSSKRTNGIPPCCLAAKSPVQRSVRRSRGRCGLEACGAAPEICLATQYRKTSWHKEAYIALPCTNTRLQHSKKLYDSILALHVHIAPHRPVRPAATGLNL